MYDTTVSHAFLEGRKHHVCVLGLYTTLCFLYLATERESAPATCKQCNISEVFYIDFYGKHLLELDANVQIHGETQPSQWYPIYPN